MLSRQVDLGVRSRHHGDVLRPRRALPFGSLVVGLLCAWGAQRAAAARERTREARRQADPVAYETAQVAVQPGRFDRGHDARITMLLKLGPRVPDRFTLRLPGTSVLGAHAVGVGSFFDKAASIVTVDAEHVEVHFGSESKLFAKEHKELDADFGRKHLGVTLLLRPELRYGWGHVTGHLPWINDFGVRRQAGAWLETDVSIVPGLRTYPTGGEGLRCGAAPITSCRDFGYGDREIIVALGPFDETRSRVALALVLLASAATVAWVVRRSLARVLDEHGVPELESDGYREVAVRAKKLEPERRRRFLGNVGVGVALGLTSLVLFARGFEGRSPIPMPYATALAAALVAAGLAALVTSRTIRRLRPLGIGLWLGAWAIFDTAWPAAALVPLALSGVVELVAAARARV